MAVTEQQKQAAVDALARDREELTRLASDTGWNLRRLAEVATSLEPSPRANQHDANLVALDFSDRQLTTVRQQLTQLRRLVRSIEKRAERQANGVFTV